MAVLVEGISVIVRRWDVNRRYPGGFRAYQATCPADALCTDRRLVRVGFGTPDEALTFVERLQTLGFVALNDGRSVDSCLVDQHHGMIYEADWLEIFHFPYKTGSLTLAALTNEDSPMVAVPKGWQFEGSLSAVVPVRTAARLSIRESA